jgi:hypothetical protein
MTARQAGTAGSLMPCVRWGQRALPEAQTRGSGATLWTLTQVCRGVHSSHRAERRSELLPCSERLRARANKIVGCLAAFPWRFLAVSHLSHLHAPFAQPLLRQ